ncbi:MAG: beta-cystathionase [Planctomycetota bacterium]
MLQPLVEQLRSLFAGMPVQSRVITGLLVAAIVVAMGFLVRGSNATQTEYLLGGRLMDERELDAAELAFGSAGLTGWHRDGRRMKIPTVNRDEFLASLEKSLALPISLRTSLQSAHEQSSAFESSQQREAREMHAKELDLGNKIAIFPDIRWASVEYDLGERQGFSSKRPQSASVFVYPEGNDALSRGRIEMIKEMIRASYSGMQLQDVVVTDANATESMALIDEQDPMLRKRREEQAEYETRIRQLLAPYGPVRIEAFVELDPTLGTEKAKLTYDDQPVTIQDSSRKRDVQTQRPLPGGVPGTQPNALSANRASKIDSEVMTSTTSDSEKTAGKVAGQEYEISRTAPLQAKRVSVSIGLPESYYKKVLHQRYLEENPDASMEDVPTPTTEQLTLLKDSTALNIKAAVTPLLPAVISGEDTFKLVEVWDYPDLPVENVAQPQIAATALAWLAQSWQSIAMIVLAIVALLFARSSLQSMGGDSDPSDFAEGFGLELPEPPAVEEEEEGEGDQMEITGASLKDELVVLVEKNPEVAANVIRSWVGEAA